MEKSYFSKEVLRLCRHIRVEFKIVKEYGFLTPYFKMCSHLTNSQFTEVVEKFINTWEMKGSFPLPANFKKFVPDRVDYFKEYPEPEDVLVGEEFSKGIKEMRKKFNL